jgi:FkbM family methyltransferase
MITIYYPKKSTWEYDIFTNDFFPERLFKREIIQYKELNNISKKNVNTKTIFVFQPQEEKDKIKDAVQKLKPDICFLLGDECGNNPAVISILKDVSLVFHQYNNKYNYTSNHFQIPLGYVSGFINENMDIKSIKERTLNASFVGQIKSDRIIMLQCFSSMPNVRLIPTNTNWEHIEKNKVSPFEINQLYGNAIFVPIGRGNMSLDCFRLYECIVSGAIPVVVGNDEEINHTFYFNGNIPKMITASNWVNAFHKCQELLNKKDYLQEIQRENLLWWNSQIKIIQNEVLHYIHKTDDVSNAFPYKTYILCHHSKEQPQRYISLQKQVEHFRLKNVSFFSNTWKDDITPKIRKTYCKSLTCTFKKEGRTQPLHDAEISIFLNYISLLRKIKEENSDGLFITIESDAVLSNDYTTRIESVIESVSQLQKWDVINIGEGTRRGLRNPKYGYPKSKPIVINGHSFHHEDIHAAIEGLIWNYDGVCKFLSEFDLTQEIDGPIDTKMDWLSINGKFNIYWLEPTLMVNGTIFNIYKSDIPKPWDTEYKTTIHTEKTYSQFGQDKIVLEYLQHKRNGFFVEIGASDGILLSNCYLLEESYNWDGICIEPIPYKFEKLQKNRKCKCIDKAVFSKSDLEVDFSVHKYGEHYEDGISGITDYLDRHKSKVKQNETIIKVKTQTLNEILEENNSPNIIDYLSLDTEGTELEILKSVNLNKYKFRIISVGHNYIKERRNEIFVLLTNYGYKLHTSKDADDFYIYNDNPNTWDAEDKTTIHRTLQSKKILHLSFHKGCINDFHYICDKLGHTCEVLSSFKECCTNQSIEPIWEPDNRHYMITHESAIKYWNRYKDYFNQFDIIVTSDTAVLSRIFLQNGWTKPLIIWICNRFDYFHTSRPDREYFELFHRATKQPNVQIIPNTLFEVLYCSLYNISLNSPEIITPLGKNIPSVSLDKTSLPNKRNTFFIPSYHNETTMMNLPLKLQELGIETYNERHKGGHDLIEFKGIITIPYAYSTLALFEHLSLGITIFVPNPSFLLSFLKDPKLNFWHQNSNMLPKYMQISEWYNEKHSKLIIYFDSWEDLKKKVSTLDYENHKSKLIEYGKKHEKDVCEKWNRVLT